MRFGPAEVVIFPRLSGEVSGSDCPAGASMRVNPQGQFPYSDFAFARAPFANGIQEGKEFVEFGVSHRGLRDVLVERGESNAAHRPLRMRPYGWERKILDKM